MVERPEFHPLAARVATSLLALLRPELRSEQMPDEGTLTAGVDLLAHQDGSYISLDCTVRVENRTRSALQLRWTLPQPPVASVHAVRVRLGERAASGCAHRSEEAEADAQRAWRDGLAAVVLRQTGPVACDVAAGWLAPSRTLELTTRHLCALAADAQRPDTSLRVQLAAAVPVGAVSAALIRRRGCAGGRRTVRLPHRVGRGPASGALRWPLDLPAGLGVLARVARHASTGVVCQSRDAAVFRGLVNGVAIRMLIAEPAADAPRETMPADAEITELLRDYRDASLPAPRRVMLAHHIADLGLRSGFVTPWTAVLALRGLSDQGVGVLPGVAPGAGNARASAANHVLHGLR